MANEGRILIYFDELVMALTKAYGATMDTHIYSPRDILSSMQGLRRVDAVEVVHGRWEIITDDYDCEMMCCSVCRSEFYDGDNDTVDCLHNYCPNCGADMRERSEGE